MLFNNDLLPVAGAVLFIIGGLFISFKYSPFPTVNNNKSLINTNSSLNSISKLDSNIQLDNLPNQSYVDASIQTANIQVEASIQATNTYVNTGMQTSARMWLESIRNWITEILGTNPQGGQYVDVGVQTNAPSIWTTVKHWFLDTFSVRSSNLGSLNPIRGVDNWRIELDSIQSIDIHDSESPLTNIAFCSPNNSSLDKLIDPNDSASQISEVVSESSLQNISNTAERVYDMSNRQDVLDLMNDPTVAFGINGAYDPADDIITFITPDTTYEILRSTLETLLNSVN